jgi:DNA-directed RNA polymerase specialized sigma24 family protein
MSALARAAARESGYPCRVLPFPATHRSVLERVRSDDAEIRRAAFGDLAQGYWRPSYHYLRLHWRLSPEDAEDAVQAFFTTAFEKGYVEAYDPARAMFRTFLRTCLDRFVQNRRKASARSSAAARPTSDRWISLARNANSPNTW